MTIKQPVINTFKRVGLSYEAYDNTAKTSEAANRFTGETLRVTPLIEAVINKIYSISDDYERGISRVNISDFDRLRYFVLSEDREAYNTCID